MKKNSDLVLFVAIVTFFAIVAGCTAAMNNGDYKIKKDITIEKFFDELGRHVEVHREHIPEEVRRNKIFRYVMITKNRVSFKEIEKRMPDSIVLFPTNCEEFYIFTDHIN